MVELVNYWNLVSVLQVCTDPRTIQHDRDLFGLEVRGRTDTGVHQQLRCVECPRGQDDFPGGHYRWPLALQFRPVAARGVAIGAIDVLAPQIFNALRLALIE